MPTSCYIASLAVAAALGAAEVCAALGAPTGLLTAARLLLLCVWVRCWSGAAGSSAGPALRCSEAAPAASAKAEAGGAMCQVAALAPKDSRRTWCSAGVQLPLPELALNLIKSRR